MNWMGWFFNYNFKGRRGILGNPNAWLFLGASTKHQVNHRQMDPRLSGLLPGPIGPAQAPIGRRPSECSCDHPTSRQAFGPPHFVVAFDDLQGPPTERGSPCDPSPRVAAIGPHVPHPEPRPQALGRGEDSFDPRHGPGCGPPGRRPRAPTRADPTRSAATVWLSMLPALGSDPVAAAPRT
jgi:hypothetical protein